jgi:Flp pilus assembly protein TadD
MGARAQTLPLRLPLLGLACLALATAAARVALPQQPASASATSIAQTIEQLRVEPPTDEAFAQALAIAYGLVADSHFAEAVPLFEALAHSRPHDPAALYGAALATFNAAGAAQAEPLVRRALAVALSDLKSPAGTTAAARAPRMRAADALVLLAVVVAVKGDNTEALKAVEQAVALAPDHFDAQLALGRARFGAGDDAGAVRAFRAAVALDPANPSPRFFLATALEHSGDGNSALAAYRELVARHPNVLEGHLGLGVLLVKTGGNGVEEGVAELQRALQINPSSYEARVTLGRTLVARGRAAESVEHLRRAAELAPGNPEPHYQLSLAYRRLGRMADAAAESAVVKSIHESRRLGGARAQSPTTPED